MIRLDKGELGSPRLSGLQAQVGFFLLQCQIGPLEAGELGVPQLVAQLVDKLDSGRIAHKALCCLL